LLTTTSFTTDVPTILALIVELASFENAKDSVQATEELLLSTLSFPAKPNAVALADFTPGFARTFLLIAPKSVTETNPEAAALPKLTDGTTVAGMALFFTNYSTWTGKPGVYLEDLYVRPAFRRLGYASVLLRELANETLRLGGTRLEWACLKWTEGALKFYRGLEANTMDEWVGLRVHGDALMKLAKGGA
jgi:GNAT superfamily N-acetyltransferase